MLSFHQKLTLLGQLNETSCEWEAPVAYPSGGEEHQWNETTKAWDEVT